MDTHQSATPTSSAPASRVATSSTGAPAARRRAGPRATPETVTSAKRRVGSKLGSSTTSRSARSNRPQPASPPRDGSTKGASTTSAVAPFHTGPAVPVTRSPSMVSCDVRASPAGTDPWANAVANAGSAPQRSAATAATAVASSGPGRSARPSSSSTTASSLNP